MTLLLMYKTFPPLDNFGFLWYHARVKLGCFATAPSDLTGPKGFCESESTFAENGAASVFFRPYEAFDTCRSCLDCHTYVRCVWISLRLVFKRFSAENGPCRIASATCDCPTAGKSRILADAQERFGADFRICGMLTAATYPEDTVLSRAVSRKSYQEEN